MCENATITFDKETFGWVEDNRGNMERSPFIRQLIREKMNAETTRLKK